MATSRASFHFFGGMRVTDEIVITADQGRAPLVRYSWPLFWAGLSFVRSFFSFLRKRGYCNGEMNEAPSRSGKEENNSAWVSVYGKFWISWRPWVYGYRRRLSPNERDIVFETKPLISSVYVREREYHLLWKEISFLSHFHVRRRAIYNSFTLGNVCRTPSVLFSPSFFFSLPLFSRLCRFFFHARKPWKFLRPPPQNFLTGKQDIPWYRVGSFLDSLPFFCSEFVVFLSFFFFFLVCRVHTNLTAREKIERRGWSFGAQFYEDNKTKYRIETPRPQVLFLLLR